jgi:hypothetical protein
MILKVMLKVAQDKERSIQDGNFLYGAEVDGQGIQATIFR